MIADGFSPQQSCLPHCGRPPRFRRRRCGWLVPYPAGSGSDIIARLIGAELAPRIGQQVIIVNQAGASGFIATQAVNNAEPDGNTLLLTTTNHVLIPTTKRDVPFDVVEGFEPVILLCTGPLVIAANPKFPHKTVSELIDAAKKAPGTINYASAGIGSAPHLAGELLSSMAGIKMVHVPYRGGAPAMTDVIAGVVPFYFSTIASALPYFESNQAFAMALTSKNRPNFAKNIPTIAEQTKLDYDVQYWYGIMAPPKTPAERIKKLHAELAQIAASPKVQEFVKPPGLRGAAEHARRIQALSASGSEALDRNRQGRKCEAGIGLHRN